MLAVYFYDSNHNLAIKPFTYLFEKKDENGKKTNLNPVFPDSFCCSWLILCENVIQLEWTLSTVSNIFSYQAWQRSGNHKANIPS